MAERVCPQCGAPIDPTATECKFCGEKLEIQQPVQQSITMQQQATGQRQPMGQQTIQQQTHTIYVQQSGVQPQLQPLLHSQLQPLLHSQLQSLLQPQVQSQVQPQSQPQVNVQQAVPQQAYVSGIDPSWPVKSKWVAGLLGIFLGSFGIHKFYLGKVGMGILYLLFCWTFIPGLIGFIEGAVYVCSSDAYFQLSNRVRIK